MPHESSFIEIALILSLATGLGQIIFTSAIGFIIAVALNMPFLTAAYVSVALTFSSTIIIVKLLSDKKEIDSLGIIMIWSLKLLKIPVF